MYLFDMPSKTGQ